VPLAVVGLVVAARGAKPDRVRAGIFLGVVVVGAMAGLVRLHATGGYCTVRHALVPGLVFSLFAASGLTWVARNAAIEGAKIGLGPGRVRPGPAIWVALVGGVLAWPYYQGWTEFGSSFTAYRMAGWWLARQPDAAGRVVDLTDWSLFFANRPGYGIGQLDEAAARGDARYVVVRGAHLEGHGRSGEIARTLVGDRAPAAVFPEHPAPGRLQVAVYDLRRPPRPVAQGAGPTTRR
jgi:hypothetical protein